MHPRNGILDTDNECHNDCVERRYNDFHSLHKKLRRNYPTIVSNLVFPKKLYSGNFNPENIGRRSQAFEQYLCHLLDTPEIRHCRLFIEFFYLRELQEGIKSFHKLQYSLSISKMSKAARNMELLYSPGYSLVILSYSVIVSCYMCLDDCFECYEFAMKAINSISLDSSSESPLLLPLLVKAVHMAVSLGKDKTELEHRISELQTKSDVLPNDIPTLQETLFDEIERSIKISK